MTRIRAGLTLFIMVTSLALGGIQFKIGGGNLSPLLGSIGFYLVLSCLRLEINTRIGKTILSASYGVYLSHFLFIEGIEFILEKLNLLPQIYTWQQEIVFTGVVFAMGLFAVILIRKFTVPRRILLGEA